MLLSPGLAENWALHSAPLKEGMLVKWLTLTSILEVETEKLPSNLTVSFGEEGVLGWTRGKGLHNAYITDEKKYAKNVS